MIKTLTLVAAVAGWATILSAQAIDPDTFKVNYLSHAQSGTPDGTVRITNVGTTAGGNICADIYLFDPNQELSECCSCLETPDGLRTLSVNFDLTLNPVTGRFLSQATIKIVSAKTSGGACPLPTNPVPVAGIHAWATHIQVGESGPVLTETEFLDSGLSAAELASLGKQCRAIQIVGSGKGVCTCGTGD
jgi:hypothetical protein